MFVARADAAASGAKVADVVTDPQPHAYSLILKLDQQIDEAGNTIPSSLKRTDWSCIIPECPISNHDSKDLAGGRHPLIEDCLAQEVS